ESYQWLYTGIAADADSVRHVLAVPGEHRAAPATAVVGGRSVDLRLRHPFWLFDTHARKSHQPLHVADDDFDADIYVAKQSVVVSTGADEVDVVHYAAGVLLRPQLVFGGSYLLLPHIHPRHLCTTGDYSQVCQ